MKPILAAVLLAAFAGAAQAQIPVADEPLYYVPSIPARIEAMPRDLPRARGPGLDWSINVAQAAVAACTAMGEKVSAQVADSVGTTVVLLSGDGAGERSQLITSVKSAVVAKYQMTGAELAKRAATDKRLAADIKDNPNIGSIRGSAQPLWIGKEFVGVLAVSGAPGKDESCAKAGLDKFPLK